MDSFCALRLMDTNTQPDTISFNQSFGIENNIIISHTILHIMYLHIL